MDQAYHETVGKLQKAGVDREYVDGWVGGYLHNPKREEQRITEGYTAGYEDGTNRNTDHMKDWVKK